MDRLQMLSMHATAGASTSHPLDPLNKDELRKAVGLIKNSFQGREISFNTVSLKEPEKRELRAYLDSPNVYTRPKREAYFVILEQGLKGITEGVVSLSEDKLLYSTVSSSVQPILTVEDLGAVEDIMRKDPNVIEQCRISGVAESEMHKVYCDPWTIGYDERWGSSKRLQQALMYYRDDEDDSQYSHPFDFCPIFDANEKKILYIDVPQIRRPIKKHIPHSNFNPKDIEASSGFRDPVKPISISQPEGVNFKMNGNVMDWQNFKFHIGFNYREGIVLNDIKFNDHGNERSMFHRLSLVEMVVPYGNPDHPHQRKHAFDLGEYGAGYMTNPLTLGCDCKGVIHYLDGNFVNGKGEPITIKNSVCIHEEDDGVLFKHSDFRDEFKTSIVTRGTKLVISQIFTAANYEYMVYWIFHQDGTIQLEIKLTGILNTYAMNFDEDTRGYGTQVYPGVNAHNHQHLFSVRIHPAVDGHDGNSAAVVDAATPSDPVGSPNNYYGNAFYADKKVFKTSGESQTDYDGTTSRTWDFFNPNKVNPYSKKNPSFKLVSRECPTLLPKEGSLVWKRAGFARHHMQVVPYKDDGFYPAGQHVPQTSGEPTRGITEWIGNGSSAIENTDIVAYHTMGITHFPAPEDFPIMPAETMSMLLRPRHFFIQNPALDVRPSHAMTTSEARNVTNGEIQSLTDKTSKLAFSQTAAENASSCCSSNSLSARNTAATVSSDDKLCNCAKSGYACNCAFDCTCCQH